MAPQPAMIDTARVARQADSVLDWHYPMIPPAWWGERMADIVARRPRLSEMPTPLVTLTEPAIDHNIAALASFCSERGLLLAPHGKTSMAPSLWARQLAAGAWAITVANQGQLAVAREFGVNRVMVANTVASPLGLRWIADQLAADETCDIMVWADSTDTVALMHDALADHAAPTGSSAGAVRRPLSVLVERGGVGGRTGTRDTSTAEAVARAVAASPHLRLVGVAGYEGALAHDLTAESMAAVRGYLHDLADTHAACSGLYETRRPIISAGGSAYFDVVADVLGPLADGATDVVLRSGAYVTHDDGFCRTMSPLGAVSRVDGTSLRSALQAWVRVVSQPEPGLAIIDAGKRDLPYDEGLPTVQLRRGRTPDESPTPLSGFAVTAVNDQHGFVRFDPDGPTSIRIGDELRLGLSHPCTAFDKWRLLPMIDDPDAPDPVVTELVPTWF